MSKWESTTRKEASSPLDGIAYAFGADLSYYVTYLRNTETSEVIKGVGDTPEESQREARQEREAAERETQQAAREERRREQERRRETAGVVLAVAVVPVVPTVFRRLSVA